MNPKKLVHFQLVLFILFCCFNQILTQETSTSCHYSCLLCVDSSYTSCISCKSSSTNIQILKSLNSSKNSSKSMSTGLCGGGLNRNANLLGILLFVCCVVFCIVNDRKEEVFFIFLSLQSISLFTLLDVAWITPLSYILQAISYLMITMHITAAYKINTDHLFYQTSGYRQSIFFVNTSFVDSISIIGFINLIAFIIIICIASARYLQKMWNWQDQHLCCSQVTIEKIELAFKTMILFSIQETVLILYFCLKYSQISILLIVCCSCYFLLLIYFLVNSYLKPFLFFRSKSAQTFTMVGKIVSPIFVVSSQNSFILIIFSVIFLLIDISLTHKKLNAAQCNRLLFYKIFTLISILLLSTTFILEVFQVKEEISFAIAILTTIAIAILIYFILVELFMYIKHEYQQYVLKKEEKVQNQMKQMQVNDKIVEQNQQNHTDAYFIGNDNEVDVQNIILAPDESLQKQKEISELIFEIPHYKRRNLDFDVISSHKIQQNCKQKNILEIPQNQNIIRQSSSSLEINQNSFTIAIQQSNLDQVVKIHSNVVKVNIKDENKNFDGEIHQQNHDKNDFQANKIEEKIVEKQIYIPKRHKKKLQKL